MTKILSGRLWSPRAFQLSILISAASLLILLLFALNSKPRDATALIEGATVSGIYRCCGSGGRSTVSWIGPTRVWCLGISYYDYQTAKHSDCGFAEKLNGAFVTARQVSIPTSSGEALRVSELLFNDKPIYSKTKAQIYERWVQNSVIGAFSGAFDIAVVIYIVTFCFQRIKDRK